MSEQANIKAISTRKGSVLLEKDGNERWAYVTDNIKPHLNKLKKGPAEFKIDQESGTVFFIKNQTGGFQKTSGFNKPQKQNPSIADTARLRRKTDCIRMAVDLCIAQQIDLNEISIKSAELYSQINKIGEQ